MCSSDLAWNTDKRYLRTLRDAGIDIVPTTFLEPGQPRDSWQWPVGAHDVVVKPTISCGSRNTLRHDAEDQDAARRHAQELLDEGRSVMVQPYLSNIDTAGETALMFFDGVFSHAIRKGALLAREAESERVEGLYLKETIDPREPSDAELAVARAVLDAIPAPLADVLYARVDLIPGADGTPHLLELELAEPSLFLGMSAGAEQRLAAAIAARL